MKLTVGSSDYDLKLFDTLEDKDSLGEIDSCDKVINMVGIANVQSQRQVFFHELVHAVLDEIGECTLSCNESFVDAFSKQLYGFFTRNNIYEIYRFINVKQG